jgi:hypothetical protein
MRVQIYLKSQNTIFLVQKYGIHPIYLRAGFEREFKQTSDFCPKLELSTLRSLT